MVLDFISAHIAVSSNDLRAVSFRRRNEGIKINQLPGGFMDVGLLGDSTTGADPMHGHFALLAGNTRAYGKADRRPWLDGPVAGARPWDWAIPYNFAAELILGAVSRYRLPPSVHDLFANDLHRRFLQDFTDGRSESQGASTIATTWKYLLGVPLPDHGGRQASPMGYWRKARVRISSPEFWVAMPISFMPTGRSAANNITLSCRQLFVHLRLPRGSWNL